MITNDNVPLVYRAGLTLRVRFELRDANRCPIDLTGWAAAGFLTDGCGADPIATIAVNIPTETAAQGVYEIEELPPGARLTSLLEGRPRRQFAYYVRFIAPNGNAYEVQSGSFTILGA